LCNCSNISSSPRRSRKADRFRLPVRVLREEWRLPRPQWERALRHSNSKHLNVRRCDELANQPRRTRL
jgi:hypothetical protein